MDFYRPPTLQGAVDAVGSIYRALRAWKFYPKGHPTRRSSISHAHSAMLAMLDGNDLQLACGRTGFSFPDGERVSDATRLTVSLSYELFVRRVHKITFLHDLHQEDLLDFIKILTLPLETIQQLGGVDKIMAEHGIRSIWVNEFDLSAIHGRRADVESRGVIPPGLDESEGEGDTAFMLEQPQAPAEDLPPEQQLQALLARLVTTSDEDIYTLLVRRAITCAETLKSRRELLAIFPLIELLTSHAEDQSRSPSMRDFDSFAIEQLVTGDLILHFIFDRIEQPGALTKNALQAVLKSGGASAIVLAVEQMGITNNLATRKMLSNMLSGLGEEAVPTLLEMLNDKRWQIVRNICAILGVIASSDAVPGLMSCLRHTEIRVCKEAIRGLAGIGGREAESAIIGILRGNDSDLYPQAIASLGGMKSRKSLTDLMRILTSKDTFLKSLPMKLDVLAAIAMIDDRQVTPRLVELLTERHLLAAGRWKQLKSAVAQCLGKLGDARALPALKEYASNPGELGAVCAEAAGLIEKSGSKPDGRT
ncbi:MAG: HEAT repeat domain-containing protein [Deltaproteobacteria bacterium]|nr:HEAT repeat domain-containing protein [Deltaproteobacteria bacterium]